MTGSLRRVWRSWFWNLLGAALMLILFCLALAMTMHGLFPMNIVMIPFAGFTGVAFVRFLMSGVTAKSEVLVVRELFKTHRLPWSDIDRFTYERVDWRTIGAPVVHLKKSSIKDEKSGECAIYLMPLGAYGFNIFGKTLPERAMEGLAEHLRRYREAHPET